MACPLEATFLRQSCAGLAQYNLVDRILHHTTTGYEVPQRPSAQGVLDPIAAEIVGRVDLRAINCPPGCPLGIAKALLFGNTRPFRGHAAFHYVATSRRFAQHMDELGSVGLLERPKYFTTLKKIDDDGTPILRTILDTQVANEEFLEPQAVNLPTVHEILEAFARVEKMRALDLRHFYHQILIGPDLQRYFTIGIGAQRFRWKSLPMGFKWACFVAQAIST